MKTISSTTGYLVEELEIGVDTEDLELTAPDPAAEQWERLAEVYSSGDLCSACMWNESGIDARGIRWRECSAFAPEVCPGVNDRSIPAYLRRQAS